MLMFLRMNFAILIADLRAESAIEYANSFGYTFVKRELQKRKVQESGGGNIWIIILIFLIYIFTWTM